MKEKENDKIREFILLSESESESGRKKSCRERKKTETGSGLLLCSLLFCSHSCVVV